MATDTFTQGVKGVWRHSKIYKGYFITLMVLGLISATANGFVPYVTGHFFDALISIQTGAAPIFSLAPWAFFLAAWTLIQAVANSIDWIMDRMRRYIDTLVHTGIQADGFIHLLHLPLSFHINAHINEVLSKISNAGWRISGIWQNIVQIAPQLLSVIIGITLAASINLILAGVLALGVTIYIVLLLGMLRTIATEDDNAHTTWNRSWSKAAETIQQITTVKQAAAEYHETTIIKDTFRNKIVKLWYSLEKTWSNIGFFQRIIVFLTQLTVFILSVHLIQQGSLTVGQLVALNGYALMFFGPFVQLGYSWQTIQNGLTAASQLEGVFERPEELYHPLDARNPRTLNGEVVYDHVSFKYGAEDSRVLTDIHFTAKPGETVALVGESGSGKSTILSLLSGYYFPDTGSVTVDGLDTRHWDLTELRKSIAVVPQELALFNDTIRTNVAYGSFDATDEQIYAAAREAHIHDFIMGLPQGYETMVGERGVKLSVGQKQRIAIARAILRNPQVLILDEPTSALDAQTERLITESLERLMEGRTTFIIAHRLSTVREADKILVIKGGCIIEEGTHEQLIALPEGRYRHLYQLHIGLHE